MWENIAGTGAARFELFELRITSTTPCSVLKTRGGGLLSLRDPAEAPRGLEAPRESVFGGSEARQASKNGMIRYCRRIGSWAQDSKGYFQNGSRMAPRCVRNGSQMGHEGAKTAPRWPSRGTKLAQDGAKLAQRGPKWPMGAPKWHQGGPKWTQDGPRWLYGDPEDAQEGAKMVPQGPKRAPIWPQMGSRGGQDGLRRGQDSPR